MSISVRAAGREDMPALVRLRLVNAERHVELDPAVYRVPDAEAVRRWFEEVLTGDSRVLLVAELSGDVVGMAEVVLLEDPPEHQILIPRRAAEIHTVVVDEHRGRGVGASLVVEAEKAAAERGVSILYAGIFAQNEGAVRFYSSAGFGPRGTLLAKALGTA
ncbi:GNAT family N-acetyltransferase [Amycolatopsis sp. NPDC051903]|uniref:GNAT family N-acetyltransferase n=1 Tax=Amycolatopsis sp. NPDC051903 TaxID=3363936 RepID=UPI0037A18B3B